MMEENSSDTLGGAASAATAKHKRRRRSPQANVFILWLEKERSVVLVVGGGRTMSVSETVNKGRDFYGDLGCCWLFIGQARGLETRPPFTHVKRV
jgi:hypothetical protein